MITYFFYILTGSILVFVLLVASKAISRGMKARKKINNPKDFNFEKKGFVRTYDEKNISKEIIELKKLKDKNILSEEEFKKAKDKILK